MSCNNCEETNPCNPCIEAIVDCACPVKDLSTDCIVYTGDDLVCSGIPKDTILTETLQLLDAFICNKFDTVVDYLSLTNVGTGIEIYKGISGIGTKEIRSIVSSDASVTVALQGTDEINLTVNNTLLKSVGDGEPIYKGIDGGDNNHKIATIKSDSLTITTEVDEGIKIETNYRLVGNGNTVELQNNGTVIDSIDICAMVKSCLLGDSELICDILNYDCDVINLPPDVVGDNDIDIVNRFIHVFTVANFTSETTPAYNDPEGDALRAVRITTNPYNGTIERFNGIGFVQYLGGEVLVADVVLGYLRFVSEDTNIATTASFDFEVSDDGSLGWSS